MNTEQFAQKLIGIVKNVPAIDTEYIEPNYITMTTFKGCIEVLNEVIEEAYYDGYIDTVEFTAKKLIEVTELLLKFNNTFGL